MPIYAYRCTTCGHAQDVLQKMSDPVLTVCPACGAAAYTKQVTAAGFQLKGSGWYVTDFRNPQAAPAAAKPEAANAATDKVEKASDGNVAAAPAADSKTPTATPAATPAAAPTPAATPGASGDAA